MTGPSLLTRRALTAARHVAWSACCTMVGVASGCAPSCPPAGGIGGVDRAVTGTAIGPAAFDAVDSVARAVVSNGEVPGLQVALVRAGQPTITRGYGVANVSLDEPVTSASIFSIFSVTKVFTASAVMRLAEQRRLALDDEVARYLPDFPRGREVTLRQLLSHTSGLKDYAGTNDSLERVGTTPERLLAYIAGLRPLYRFEPGSAYEYSNSNYVLLGAIIERVSGMAYGQYVQDSVIARAHVQRTAVDPTTELVPGRVTGYVRGPSGFVRAPIVDMSFIYAAGGIRSTALDLATWFTEFFAGNVVSPPSLREMLAPARVRSGQLAGDLLHESGACPGSMGYYGLGIRSYRLAGHRVTGPGGSYRGFSAKVSNYVDDGFTLVVLANVGDAAAGIEARMARAILRVP